jgi:hypothetical protein
VNPTTQKRCPEKHNVLQCQGSEGHRGRHWADTGRSPAVLRWGVEVGYGCADTECVREPGHELPHRNGKGLSWWPEDEVARTEES